MAQVLGPVKSHPATRHDDLLVGISTGDDAGVYALGDGRALIQTVDIFTPVVDSPRDWGRIAAANALSDVYAMGGRPVTALQYLAWPRDELELSVASEVIEGGLDVMAEAGCVVVGGHSIDSPEPTYGFAVTGIGAPDSLVSNAAARPGDKLVLSKPLGMGIITTAIKRGKCPPELEAEAIEMMARLNDQAGEAMVRAGASAATDVTGFGLIGHLLEMCDASGVGGRLVANDIPILDGVTELLAAGMWPGGSRRNQSAFQPRVTSDLTEERLQPFFDAQTSGGLLISIAPDRVESLLESTPGASIVGEIEAGDRVRVT